MTKAEADAEANADWIASRLREQGTELWALRRKLQDAEDLAHEVYRFLHGLEPPSIRRNALSRALARYREPTKEHAA